MNGQGHASCISPTAIRLLSIAPSSRSCRCAPLSALLGDLCVTHIDWWVLDVEGAELVVLKGVDWSAVTIDVITVEASGTSPEKDAAVIELLVKAGYVHDGTVLRNDWFHASSYKPQWGGHLGGQATTVIFPQLKALLPGWVVYWSAGIGKHYFHKNDPWELTMTPPKLN